MTDPLRDERFPDRPQTQDFWRLAEIVMEHDGRTDGPMSEQAFRDFIAETIDADSLIYMLKNRAKRVVQQNAEIGMDSIPEVVGGACWLDGFLAGAKFAERGGHRAEPA